MVPRAIIRGELLPGLTSEVRAMCVHLFSHLDEVQRGYGRPEHGYKRAARALGWDWRTVRTYAEMLQAAGLIVIEREKAKGQHIMRVIVNPARKGMANEPADAPEVHSTQLEGGAQHAPQEVHSTHPTSADTGTRDAPQVSSLRSEGSCAAVAGTVPTTQEAVQKTARAGIEIHDDPASMAFDEWQERPYADDEDGEPLHPDDPDWGIKYARRRAIQVRRRRLARESA